MARKDRHTDLGLKEEDLIEMYRFMLLARFCDERQWALEPPGQGSVRRSRFGTRGRAGRLRVGVRERQGRVLPLLPGHGSRPGRGFTPQGRLPGTVRQEGRPVVGRTTDAGALGCHATATSSRARRRSLRSVCTRPASPYSKKLKRVRCGRRDVVRRGRNLRGRLARRDELRRHPQAPVGLRLREQPVRDLRSRSQAGRRPRLRACRRVTACRASRATATTCSSPTG